MASATRRPSESPSRIVKPGSTQPSISIRRVRPVHRARAWACTTPGTDPAAASAVWIICGSTPQLARRDDVVIAELAKLHSHLLAPLGVAAAPCCLGQVVAGYRAARDDWEQVLRHRVSRAAETTVLPTLRQLTMSTQ